MECPIATSELSTTQRHMYSPTPTPGFFDAFQTAYEKFDPQVGAESDAGASSPGSFLVDVLGATQTEMADLRGVSEADQQQYAAILHEAYAGEGVSDPQEFLQSLSPTDLDIVRRMHGLADTIDPSGLSDEGASNLLLPEGYSVDLNHDGIDEVGLGKMLHFPPRDAPPAFTEAWFEATKDMSFGDYALHAMSFLVAFHPPTETGDVATALPTNQLGSYRTVVDNYLWMLDHYRGMLAEGQYERDQPFFSRLKSLLEDT